MPDTGEDDEPLRAPRRLRERGPRAASLAAGVAVTSLIVTAVAGAACDPSRAEIDPFPIHIDTSAGPVFARASVDDGEPVPAVIDTLSPKSAWVRAGDEPGRRYADVTLWNAPPGGEPPVPRARFPGATIFEVDPCRGASPCLAGVGDAGVPFEAIIGTDVLAGVAVAFDFSAPQLRLYPDIALGDLAHEEMCKAVFRRPFAGGGTLVIDGVEESFDGRRAVLGACLDFAEAPAESQRGASALLLLSTGAGPTILGESAYARYRGRAGGPAVAELPVATVHLPGGPVRARIGAISSLALASEESDERGPCREIYTYRVMRRDGCRTGEVDPCPCPDGATRCRAGAVVDLGGPVEVAVIPDSHPVLQSLRSELRPGLPDVDGILGTRALAGHRVEVDYPNNRILFSCADADGCATFPGIRTGDVRDAIAQCPAPL